MDIASISSRNFLVIGVAALSLLLMGAGIGYLFGSHARSIDWSATGAFLQGLAALIAAGVAWWGVNQWQKELRFKRNSELAEKVMVCVEALGDAITQARNTPDGYEMYEPLGDPRVLTHDSYRLRAALLNHKDYAAEIRTHIHRVGVLFGVKHRIALEFVLDLNETLRTALFRATWESSQLENPDFDRDDIHAELVRLSPTLFEGFEDAAADRFEQQLNWAFEQVRNRFQRDL